MAAIANRPTVQETPVHVFSEIPAKIEHDCEICKKGPAAYRWTQSGSVAGDSLICRVCASMIVLVGKPT